MHRFVHASALSALLLVAGSASAQDDVGEATEAICCGGACCLIGGDCFGRDEPNPEDACQVCDPSTSQSEWTDVDPCGGTDAGAAGSDAGPIAAVDAGTTPPRDDGGCSVSPGRGSLATSALAFLALGALMFRRRR